MVLEPAYRQILRKFLVSGELALAEARCLG